DRTLGDGDQIVGDRFVARVPDVGAVEPHRRVVHEVARAAFPAEGGAEARGPEPLLYDLRARAGTEELVPQAIVVGAQALEIGGAGRCGGVFGVVRGAFVGGEG